MSLLVKYLGVPVAERLKGWPVRKYLAELQQSQWWSPERLRALQDQKVRTLIRHAYETVPYYRRLFDTNGLKPEDVSTVDDLPRLPTLSKDAIRAAGLDAMLSSKFQRSELVAMSSSGSTGEPFRYYLTEDEKARKWAALFRFWSWAGFRLCDRYAVLAARPYRAFTSGVLAWLEARFSGALNLSAFQMYEEEAVRYAERLAKFKPLMLRGYASSLYYLAQVVKERWLQLRLNAVCSTGETLFRFQRELIETVFHCKVFDAYGGEGMETAGQCDQGTYHINAEGVVVEVVDDRGRRCSPGVPGRVVLTDLNHYSMPFIRYDIQDLATYTDRACPCGRALPALGRIYGRLTDVGVTPSGKAILVHHFTALFMKHVDAVEAFQVVQEQPSLFVVKLVPGARFAELRDTVLAELQQIVGSDCKVEIVILDKIPLGTGAKRRLFVSRCGLKGASLADLTEVG